MRALVYHGPGNKAWEEAPKPTVQDPTDATVRSTPSPSAAPLWAPEVAGAATVTPRPVEDAHGPAGARPVGHHAAAELGQGGALHPPSRPGQGQERPHGEVSRRLT